MNKPEQPSPLKRRKGPVPRPQEQQLVSRSIRLNDAHYAKLKRLGRGWLEQAIDAAA